MTAGKNSCPTPPLLLHPSFPLNGAISTNTLGSGPQKYRRLRPIAQINWHEWADPYAACEEKKENGSMQLHYCKCVSLVFCSKTMELIKREGQNGKEREGNREWCCPLRFNKRIVLYLCAYTHSTAAVRNTPVPCAHTDADTITRWLCSRIQSARPISAAGLVSGSFIEHKWEQLWQCKTNLAKVRNDHILHPSPYLTEAIKHNTTKTTTRKKRPA